MAALLLPAALALPVVVVVGIELLIPIGHADPKQLNAGVAANVYAIQHHSGCTNGVRIDPQLQLAARWHAVDLVTNSSLDGDIGSNGSTPQDRATSAGFGGKVAETVTTNPALGFGGVSAFSQWYYTADDYAIVADCANSAIGVWSASSRGRTVVVAVYGQPRAIH